MTTLKQIKGSAIQFLDADPVEYVGTWSSGGNVNTARAYGGSSGTSRDAAMYFGGYTTPTNYANTEQYNGTSWTEVNDLSNSRTGLAGFGNSLTSAVAFGGDEFPAPSPRYLADVEEWNGTNWTSGTNLPAATQQQNGAGTLTAGLAIGGDQPSSPNLTQTLEYDGTNWTSGGNLNTGKQFARVSCGLQTAALIAGAPGYSATTEQYNGTAWTEVNDLNTAGAQGGGGGTYTSAITSGNQNTASSNAESWDGTSWTETNNRSTDNYALGGSGSSNQNGVVHHGYDSSPAGFPTATEEWAFPPVTASTLNEGDMWFNSSSSTLKGYAKSTPSGSWSSGGSLNTARAAAGASSGSDGNTSLFIISGGTPNSVNVEEYDGSAFTEIANVNNAGENGMSSGNGSTVATIFTGGNPPRAALTESWNGSSWTEVNDLNTGRGQAAGIGTQTAALVVGNGNTESWDGSSWTEVSDLNQTRRNNSGMGSSTLAIVAGGRTPASPAISNHVETWNGSSWTETTEINTARAETSGSGVPYNNVIVIGGEPSKANTEFWNGSTWTEVGDMATAGSRISQNMGASANATLAFLQASPSVTTEEWTADNAVLTVTTS